MQNGYLLSLDKRRFHISYNNTFKNACGSSKFL